jgi:hypothetical protein
VVDIEKLDEFFCCCRETLNYFPSYHEEGIRERIKKRERNYHFVKVYAYYK